LNIVDMVANTLLKLGVVQAPTIILTPTRKRRGPEYKTVNAEAYNPDFEFERLLDESSTVFDFTKSTDPMGRPFEVTGQLYEVASNGKSYRLQRFNSKDQLLETLDHADKTWALLENQYFSIAPPWKMHDFAALKSGVSMAAKVPVLGPIRNGLPHAGPKIGTSVVNLTTAQPILTLTKCGVSL